MKVRQSTNSVSMTLPIIIESDNIENKTEEKFVNDFSITQESGKLHIKCRDVIKNGLVSIISLNGEILKSSKITDTERGLYRYSHPSESRHIFYLQKVI